MAQSLDDEDRNSDTKQSDENNKLENVRVRFIASKGDIIETSMALLRESQFVWGFVHFDQTTKEMDPKANQDCPKIEIIHVENFQSKTIHQMLFFLSHYEDRPIPFHVTSKPISEEKLESFGFSDFDRQLMQKLQSPEHFETLVELFHLSYYFQHNKLFQFCCVAIALPLLNMTETQIFDLFVKTIPTPKEIQDCFQQFPHLLVLKPEHSFDVSLYELFQDPNKSVPKSERSIFSRE